MEVAVMYYVESPEIYGIHSCVSLLVVWGCAQEVQVGLGESAYKPTGPRVGPGGGKDMRTFAAKVLQNKARSQVKVPSHEWKVPDEDDRDFHKILEVVDWGEINGKVRAQVRYGDQPIPTWHDVEMFWKTENERRAYIPIWREYTTRNTLCDSVFQGRFDASRAQKKGASRSPSTKKKNDSPAKKRKQREADRASDGQPGRVTQSRTSPRKAAAGQKSNTVSVPAIAVDAEEETATAASEPELPSATTGRGRTNSNQGVPVGITENMPAKAFDPFGCKHYGITELMQKAIRGKKDMDFYMAGNRYLTLCEPTRDEKGNEIGGCGRCHKSPGDFVAVKNVFCYPCESGMAHSTGGYGNVEETKREKYKCTFVLCATCAGLNWKDKMAADKKAEEKSGGQRRSTRTR